MVKSFERVLNRATNQAARTRFTLSRPSFALPKTSRELGVELETRVERFYQRTGGKNIKRNVILHDRFGNVSEIDLVVGRSRKIYVECKNYSDKPVPLSDVAKFKEVLQLNNIPIEQGVFITTSTFTPRATTIGIKCIDGDQLKVLEQRAQLRRFRLPFMLAVAAAFAALAGDPTTWGSKAALAEAKLQNVRRQIGEFTTQETLMKLKAKARSLL